MQKAMLMGLTLTFGTAGGGCSSGFDRIVKAVGPRQAIVFTLEGGSRVLVSPLHQGRIMTTEVGAVDSVAFVCLPEIAEGEIHEQFNNFGGQDRFWIGPEAGQFGIYFPPGAELKRDRWVVPPDFNRGPFTVVEKTPSRVLFRRDISVTNYQGGRFRVQALRDAGVIPASSLREELGVTLPSPVYYAGSYSQNRMTNLGEPWKKETGLINIWILGQFNPGPRAVIIAPFKEGEGPAYRDETYFGKVSPERLQLTRNAVLLKADGKKESKFGIPQARSTGRAGSFDFDRNLLVVVKFDVPAYPALYGNSAWLKEQSDPYLGDVFQAYNSEAEPGRPSERYAFYELESVSPSLELNTGQSVSHRHATYCFQGDYGWLRKLAQDILEVDLDEVRRRFS